MTTQSALQYSIGQSPLHTNIHTVQCLGLSILPKDTLASRMWETGIETPTFWLVDDPSFSWATGAHAILMLNEEEQSIVILGDIYLYKSWFQ